MTLRGAVTKGRRIVFAATVLLVVYALAIAVIGLRDDIGPVDAAVVLGSMVGLDGAPSPRLAARLDKAVDLYRQGLFDTIIVSGGFAPEGYDEATVMRDYLVARGVPSEKILVDSQGYNTAETAKYCAASMKMHGLGSFMVVTQYFHIPRSRLAMHLHGVENVRSAHADFFEIHDLYSILREMAAIPFYLLTDARS